MSEHHPIRSYRAFLARNSRVREEVVKPSGLGGLVLVVVGGLLMRFTHGWSLVAALALVVAMMVARLAMRRQVERELRDLAVARRGFESTGDPRYLEVLTMQGQRMLKENRVLSDPVRTTVERYVSYAQRAEP